MNDQDSSHFRANLLTAEQFEDRRTKLRAAHIARHVVNPTSAQVSNIARGAQTNATTQTKKADITMAKHPDPKHPSNKPSNGPQTQSAKPSNGSPQSHPDNKGDKPKKSKKARVRWVSTTEPGFWVRSFKDVTDKFGAPKDHNGVAMIAKIGVPFGQVDPAAKAAKLAAKAAEEARKAAMTDEEKLAFARQKREAAQATKAAKQKAEYEQLVAQVKADIAAGRL